jgi:DNA-binding CsgD family transcriptional regulator
MNAAAQCLTDHASGLGLSVYIRQRSLEADSGEPPGYNPSRTHRLLSGDVEASIDELPSPLALLGVRGSVEFANAAARQLLARVCAAGSLASGIAALAGSAFGELLQHAAGSGTASRFWAVERKQQMRCGNLRVARLGADSIYQRAWPQAAFVAVLDEFPVSDECESRLAAVADRFGLTPAERRVLGCLQRGRRRCETARELGVAENTVASHVKSIYMKAGVHRLVDLMRML